MYIKEGIQENENLEYFLHAKSVFSAKTIEGENSVIQVFFKLLNKGLRESNYNKFPFHIQEGNSLTDLIDRLMSVESFALIIPMDISHKIHLYRCSSRYLMM